MNRVLSASGFAATCGTVVRSLGLLLSIVMLAACPAGDVGQTAQGGGSPGTGGYPLPTVSISANPANVASGGSSMLTWSAIDATSCVASGGWVGPKGTSGSQSTGALTAGSTFALTCTGLGGTASASAAVTVQGGPPPAPAPTVSLTANPTSVSSGGSSALTWSSTNATSCTASGGWSGLKATSGNNESTGALASTTTFNLSCSGAGGTASTSRTVSVVTPPVGGQDFQTRCNQLGVVKCVGFDSAADIPSGLSGANFGIFSSSGNSSVMPTLDTGVKASGNSSLKFTIPSNSGADTSGSYFTNFSSDLSVQFGENQVFYVQWRQRFTTDFLTTEYAGASGWKQVIIGTGDQPGGILYFSCTDLETVLNNGYYRGFPGMYNSCGASSAHGPFDGFEEPFGASDFKLQNARGSPFCLYSQGNTSYFPPVGNCFAYFANEWMTFQVRIQTGPRVNDVFTNSFVTLWMAREGGSSELVIHWGPYSLNAGTPGEDQKFGKVWLLPYNTGKDRLVTYPETYTWYDELIISRNQIADPAP